MALPGGTRQIYLPLRTGSTAVNILKNILPYHDYMGLIESCNSLKDHFEQILVFMLSVRLGTNPHFTNLTCHLHFI